MIVANHHRFLRAGFPEAKERFRNTLDGLTEELRHRRRAPRRRSGRSPAEHPEGDPRARARAQPRTSSSSPSRHGAWTWQAASSCTKKYFPCAPRARGSFLFPPRLDEILGIADSIVVMYRGRVVAQLANDQNARATRTCPSSSRNISENTCSGSGMISPRGRAEEGRAIVKGKKSLGRFSGRSSPGWPLPSSLVRAGGRAHSRPEQDPRARRSTISSSARSPIATTSATC